MWENLQVSSVDKFPLITVPEGVVLLMRIVLSWRLSPGTTIMHEVVNFNAGTLGASIEADKCRCRRGDGSDVGGGASIMGTRQAVVGLSCRRGSCWAPTRLGIILAIAVR